MMTVVQHTVVFNALGLKQHLFPWVPCCSTSTARFRQRSAYICGSPALLNICWLVTCQAFAVSFFYCSFPRDQVGLC